LRELRQSALRARVGALDELTDAAKTLFELVPVIRWVFKRR
jgi:hypothetical protein